MKSPYEILGVPRDATESQIKAAKRSAASRVHPDRPGGSIEAMAEVNTAYDILIDPQRRKEYDETGRTQRQNTLADAVRDTLVNTVTQLVERNMVQSSANMLAIMRKGMTDTMGEVRGQAEALGDKAERLEKKLAQITAKNGEQLLLDILSAKADELRGKKQQLDNAIIVLEATLKALECYDEPVIDQPMSSMAQRQGAILGGFFQRNMP